MISRMAGLAGVVACSVGSAMAAPVPALKPINSVAVQAAVEGLAKKLLLPGALVLLKTPQGDFVFSYGTTEVGIVNRPDSHTHFRAASNTKTMTAAVIVQLAQERKLRFDDPISNYVQDVPNGDNISIRQLLKMRSGLYNYTSAPELAQSLDRNPQRVWTSEQLRVIAFQRPPLFAPGAKFDYCNTNYLLLGLAAEKIEGKPLASIFQDRLFGPLGMKNTLLPPKTSNAIPEPYAHGYLYGGSSYALVDKLYPNRLRAAARAQTLKPNDDTLQNPSYAFAAGNVISTADDLAIWMGALVGGKVFSSIYQRQWMESLEAEDAANPNGQQYGYGISRIAFGSNKVYFHGGEMPGYNSFMGYDPDNDVALIVWTSLTVSLDGMPTANTLMLRVLKEIYSAAPGAQKP